MKETPQRERFSSSVILWLLIIDGLIMAIVVIVSYLHYF